MQNIADAIAGVRIGEPTVFRNLMVFPAVGEGVEIRMSGPALNGAALVVDDHIVHLSAFAVID